ncbi:hypothetical protein, partial [Flavobacterium branchiophilum]
MQKLNSFLFIMLLLALSNFSFGQQNPKTYIIGSTLSTGDGSIQDQEDTCYPATPASIRPIVVGISNQYDTNINNNSYLVSTNNADYGDIILKAYKRGFRHFYFQEGLYVVSTPINLNGLNGITIEGAGARTTFKAGSTTLEAIFKISNNYNSKIMNLNMDLKTTLNCGAPTDAADANTGIKIGGQVGRCLFEGLFFRSYIGADNASMVSNSPILIELASGQESDWNTFNNIHFQRCKGGIVLDINGGIFNSNVFSNIHLEHFLVGIDFQGSGGQIEGNLFTNIDAQASKVAEGLKVRTLDVIKNVRGANNVFNNIQVSDYEPCIPDATGNIPTNCAGSAVYGYVVSLTDAASRTTIAYSEIEGRTNNNSSEEKAGWYNDQGKGTNFVGNASTDRKTDYIVKDINDLYYEGKIEAGKTKEELQNSSKFNFLAYKNFNRVQITNDPFSTEGSGINMFTNSRFTINNYKSIDIGNRGAAGAYNVDKASNLSIYGNISWSTHNSMSLDGATTGTGLPPASTNTHAKKYVITNADTTGAFQWTKIGDLTWNHIAIKNIKLDGFAITNNSNATPATNTDAGLRLDNGLAPY